MSVYVKTTKKMGRGVFAGRALKKGAIVFRNHVLILPGWERKFTENTTIVKYEYGWPDPKDEDASAIALGLGSLLNHSDRSNLHVAFDVSTNEIIFIASRDIKPGHQLFIDYGYDPSENEKVYRASEKKHRRKK